MACFHPIKGYASRKRGPSGKRSIVFRPQDGFFDLPVSVPCGGCVGCRLEYARQWAVRCMHEASLYEQNCFVTLTYSDRFLPPGRSLDREAFPLFMKRLRKWLDGRKVRYFHCGEYGSRSVRPHYHALLFGLDFADKEYYTTRGENRVFTSKQLARLWPFGLSEIGSVTFGSAAYVARYALKKAGARKRGKRLNVYEETGECFEREEEYVTMSRRPGIGAGWLARYMCEVYPADGVVVNGELRKPPRFYDGLFELNDPKGMRLVRKRRSEQRDLLDSTQRRLAVREKVTLSRLALGKRDAV